MVPMDDGTGFNGGLCLMVTVCPSFLHGFLVWTRNMDILSVPLKGKAFK